MAISMSDDKVTPEVRNMFGAKPRPEEVKVIIAVKPGHMESVAEALASNGPLRHTDYYVFAGFSTLGELNRLVQRLDDSIEKVWVDKQVKSLVTDAERTAKALPARQVFDTEGEGVIWAVLDTGINFSHQWFVDSDTASEHSLDLSGDDPAQGADQNGHGTHVAGIVFSMAPSIALADFKVLNKDGEGSDSQIIEAMWQIRKINLDARRLVIHGANVSIGGTVPVGSYGVGASPVCQEANRLMNSGVVVCVAAGNSGHESFLVPREGDDGAQMVGVHESFLDLSIEDPANAEEVITVGSVHKEKPHTYGVSYFSSKGPTGDGRLKPDIVAPGEKIWSADYKLTDSVVEMSGTSMAAPVVSGVIALLLGRHPELIGQSRRIKELAMDTATDLRRDRYFQGAGMIDALRLLQAV